MIDKLLVILKKEKRDLLLQASLILMGLVFFSFAIRQYPLVDADEATYAQITDNMLKSGDIWSLKLLSGYWLEKPPLFFWLSTISVKLFGPQEFAYRIPSVVAAVLTLWLVFLIVRNLSNSRMAAVFASLVLLFSPEYYVFGREARLDPGVVFGIMLSLYFLIAGWSKDKYYLGVFPAIAVGILFKNLVAGLALPVMVIFSIAYKRWGWLKSRYFWWGLPPAFLILAPWHIIQSMRFGWEFWKVYLVHAIFQHSVSTVAGSADSLLYLKILFQYHVPWIYVILSLIALILIVKFWKKLAYRISQGVWAAFFSAFFIVILFSFLKTHLSTYILPAFPFFAMFVAFALFDIFSVLKISDNFVIIICLFLLVVGGIFSLKAVHALVTPLYYEERDVGRVLKQKDTERVPVYVLDWPFLETVSYYGSKKLLTLGLENSGTTLKAPFYLVTNNLVMTYFYNREGNFISGYEDVNVLYGGQYLVLIYTDKDLVLPVFSHR